MQVLKVGVPNVVFRLFAPQEEAVGFEFPSQCGSLLLGWGLLRDCVSASPALVLCLFSAVFVVRLDFTFQRKLPYIAVDLVYSLEE